MGRQSEKLEDPQFSFILTEKRIKQMMGRAKRSKPYIFICPCCGKNLELGQRLVHVLMGRYVHLECLPKFRIDVEDEEDDDKELEDFFVIV